jgi:hypothetical protein
MAKLDMQVKFLRGTQAQLNAITTDKIKEGSFYLTNDTDRLYVGKADGKLALLNQGVKIIVNQSELPAAGTPAAELNDFYYIVNGNILAYYDKTTTPTAPHYVQINPDEDTKLVASTEALKAAVADNVATVSMVVADEKGNQAVGSYKVSAGSDNVSIAATADGYSIAVAAPDTVDYSVEAKDGTSENEVKVDLMKAIGSQEATVDSTVTLKAAGKASIDLVGDAIVITGADQTIDSAALDFDANGNLGLTIVQKGTTIPASEVAPVIKIGTKDDEIKFLSGAADLPVYTMEEIDEKLANYESKANAMSYKGTVAAYEDLPTEGLEKGDLYMLSAADDPYEAGDLFIYDGEKWDYVPAGNDVDTTYLFKADTTQNRLNVVQKQGGVETSVGSVAVKGSGVITATPEAVGDNNLTITVSHNEVTDTSPAKGAAAQESKKELKFDVVESVTKDEYGHVSAVATKEITVVDTHNNLQNVIVNTATVTNGAEISTAVNMTDGESSADKFAITSESLKVTAVAATEEADAQVKLELVWESFA